MGELRPSEEGGRDGFCVPEMAATEVMFTDEVISLLLVACDIFRTSFAYVVVIDAM